MGQHKVKQYRRAARKAVDARRGEISERAVTGAINELVAARLKHRLAACVYILFGAKKEQSQPEAQPA